MTGWWIAPELPLGHLELFGALLLLSLVWQNVISPRRRRLLGPLLFNVGAAITYGIPLFGVIVLRAGWRHAFLDAGRGWWSALWLSLFWMLVFLATARLFVRVVPPFSGWMRAWRKAQVEGFKMMFGFGGRRPPQPGDPEGMRVVGRSKA